MPPGLRRSHNYHNPLCSYGRRTQNALGDFGVGGERRAEAGTRGVGWGDGGSEQREDGAGIAFRGVDGERGGLGSAGCGDLEKAHDEKNCGFHRRESGRSVWTRHGDLCGSGGRTRRLARWVGVHYLPRMATYIYETLSEPARRFEIQQSMKDDALTKHPETGEPIRRVITGGLGLMSTGNAPRHADMQRASGGGSCGTGCGCH